MKAATGRAQPLPSLTALRFFAAGYVLLFHCIPRPPLNDSPGLLRRWLEAGFTGVSLFFILSGFILAYNHQQVRNVGSFLRARFARIYPLYLFSLLLLVPSFLRPGHDVTRVWTIVADLLLVQTWFASIALGLNTPAWTLSCEAFFYVLFPALLPLMKKLQGSVRSPVRGTVRGPAQAVLLLWLAQLSLPCISIFLLEPAHPGWTSNLNAFLLMPVARVGEFAAGIVMGLSFQRNPRSTSPWLVLFALLACLLALSLNLRLPHQVVRNGLLVGPYSLLIWALAGWRSRLLSSAPLQLGGEISYGMYILQLPFGHLLNSVREHLHSHALDSAWCMLAILPFSFLTYECIEKPCRNFILRRSLFSAQKPIPTPQVQLP